MFPDRSSAKRSKARHSLRTHNGSAVAAHAAIPERKSTPPKHERNEERFEAMAEDAPVMIWARDESGKCTYFNKKWLAHTGRSLEKELGDGWTEGVHPEDRASVMNRFRKAFAARSPFELEYRLRNASGQYPWVIDRGEPIYSAEGFLGYIGSAFDI